MFKYLSATYPATPSFVNTLAHVYLESVAAFSFTTFTQSFSLTTAIESAEVLAVFLIFNSSAFIIAFLNVLFSTYYHLSFFS